jgi:hypothetical protein
VRSENPSLKNTQIERDESFISMVMIIRPWPSLPRQKGMMRDVQYVHVVGGVVVCGCVGVCVSWKN